MLCLLKCICIFIEEGCFRGFVDGRLLYTASWHTVDMIGSYQAVFNMKSTENSVFRELFWDISRNLPRLKADPVNPGGPWGKSIHLCIKGISNYSKWRLLQRGFGSWISKLQQVPSWCSFLGKCLWDLNLSKVHLIVPIVSFRNKKPIRLLLSGVFNNVNKLYNWRLGIVISDVLMVPIVSVTWLWLVWPLF